MEASSNKIGRSSPGDLLSTRRGAVTVAAGAAILAGILLFVFVQRYKDNANSSAAATSVFVARSLIPQGSSADLIASEQLMQRTSLKGSQVQDGAIVDPAVLHGQVAAVTIYPGQQITAADFTHAVTIASNLTSTQRAVAIPVDSAHGLIGFVHAGDYVDVLASYNGGAAGAGHSVTPLMQNVLVLSTPNSSGGGIGGNNSNNSNIVLRVSDSAAPGLAYAADNGKVWVVLRPPVAASQTNQPSSSGAAPTSGSH
jgi:Flp pilus assembly protein CpaB